MTKRYPGGYITKTPPTVSTTSAPGIWTMEQQAAYQKAGTWPFGGPFVYIEDVFSTWLYTGTGASQTITNGIDLSGQGGLVWTKNRSTYNYGHQLFDTARGAGYDLATNSTAAQNYDLTNFSSFNSTGFTIGPNANANVNGVTNVSWTFRKQPKFFDVVTYTGNGSPSGQTISHNLGSVPGCIIVKCVDIGYDWFVYHRSLGNTQFLNLDLTNAATSGSYWNNTSPTSTSFTVNSNEVNRNGNTFVAYLFAHNAGGFGLTGTDNVISCGSYTAGSSETTVNLGFEPQWTMIKASSTADEWRINDNMRGVATGGIDRNLWANLSNAEAGSDDRLDYNATGFTAKLNNSNPGETYIYIAIRRGPMKTPTDATKVFGPAIWTGTGTNPRTFTDSSWGFVGDYLHNKSRSSASYYNIDSTRLTGSGTLSSNDTGAELNSSTSVAGYPSSWNQTGFTAAAGSGSNNNFNASGETYVGYMWSRAPGFFDVVCYTANNGAVSPYAITHNLTVAPELIIVKNRSTGGTDWAVYSSALGNNKVLFVNSTAASSTTSAAWAATTPTATYFYVGNSGYTNLNFDNYVAYLFASCPGVSKVGSYTGTGTTKQIDCGFTGGARFVLIKRTDSTGDWYYWDSARGIVAGNDPYLLMNTSAAEVTNTDYVDAYSAGFEISSTAPAAINANGGSFIFLAVA